MTYGSLSWNITRNTSIYPQIPQHTQKLRYINQNNLKNNSTFFLGESYENLMILTENSDLNVDEKRYSANSDDIKDGPTIDKVRPLPVPRSGRGPLKCPFF
jgi:hypothetical protein